ncbi:MAG: TetR/AcrR family transcriptional regulator [Culturomica sp.]|jgi:AcrR family transcriptional regulator|nr:TetR/AcrR family transcriptional regulator [Culturomica sp.]
MTKTKNQIINVAKELFQKVSVYKLTMNDIATAAKMSRRTLYTHFKSKTDIYHYVVENEVRAINRKLQKAADSQLPPDRKLRLYVIQHFNVIDSLTKTNRYIRYDFLFNNLRVENLRKDIDKKEIELLTKIIIEGNSMEIFKINNPAEFSKTLLLTFKSLEQAFILNSKKGRSTQRILEYIDILFYGIMNNQQF